MPLPADVPQVTVTGDIRHPITGDPAIGTVTFSTPQVLRDATSKVALGTITYPLVLSGGKFTVPLVATDAAQIAPLNWTWTVTVATNVWSQTFQFSLPSTPNAVAFSDLVPAQPPPAVVNYLLANQKGAASGVASLGPDGILALAQRPPAGGGSVTSVAATDSTIVVSGNPNVNPSVAVGVVAQSQVTGLTAALAARTPIVRSARIANPGDATFPNTNNAWAVFPGFELDIPAAVGEWVELGIHAMRSNTPTALVDVGIVVGANIVRYLATGTASPAFEGDPGWYPNNGFSTQSGARGLVVAAGDLDGGNLRFAIVCKAGGSGLLYSSTNYPFYWRALNMRQTS